MIRLLFFAALGYACWWLFKNRQSSRTQSLDRNDRQGRIDDVMVQDPHCGVYFPKRNGVRISTGQGELVFCSEKCRDAYIEARNDTNDT